MPITVSADSDGDGVSDAADDCKWSSGTSTIDKTGCPDFDGDGTSDINDPWTTSNPNFQTEQILNSNQDYNDIEYSGDGYSLVIGVDDGFVRTWNSSTFVNVRSANLGSQINSVAFSPNSNLVAAGVDDDTVHIFDAATMTSLYGSISVDVGSGERVNDVEFSLDSSLLAVSIGRSGNQGTNGIVSFINTSTGNFFSSGINPGGEDRFYDTAFSPDSNFIAVASEGDWYISEIATGTTVASISSPPDSVNAIAWSPDGNYIVMCGAYESNGARVQVHEYDGSGWPIIWEVGTSTSCSSVDFSPDGSKFIVGMYWYEADGATAKIYETTSSLLVDAFSGPRPNNCAGNNVQCGQIDGVSWHPDGGKIVTAHTRNDEGVYFWYADLDEDQDGYNTYDQGDGVVDAFPTDGSQWNDTDGDGYGDNPAPATNPDACISQFGTSTEDRYGCPDADGDGWSDAGDWAPNDPEQWVDSDGDGYGDQYYYDVTAVVFHTNQRGDAFPNNPTQWNDSDSDGWGDNYNDESWEVNRGSTWPGLLIINATQDFGSSFSPQGFYYDHRDIFASLP
jgi:WD40 repeat protein